MKGEMLSTTQVAARLGVGRSTVNLWCRQGKFPNAEARKEVIGNVWYVPESDLEGFTSPTMGRPPKAKPAQSNGRKKGLGEEVAKSSYASAGNAPSGKKKGDIK